MNVTDKIVIGLTMVATGRTLRLFDSPAPWHLTAALSWGGVGVLIAAARQWEQVRKRGGGRG